MSPPPIHPWPPAAMPLPEPVDILTFHYNKNMAYAPAPNTYDVCGFARLFVCFLVSLLPILFIVVIVNLFHAQCKLFFFFAGGNR
jgi:hypothetical protein